MDKRKWCFVPECKNTSVNSPEKIFVSVPNQVQRRIQWFIAAKRLEKISVKSHLYCCEDHFKLEEDAENYLQYKLGYFRLRMKPEVVPHIFYCQADKNECDTFKSGVNRAGKGMIDEIVQETAMPDLRIIPNNPHLNLTTSDKIVQETAMPNLRIIPFKQNPEPTTSHQRTSENEKVDKSIKSETVKELYIKIIERKLCMYTGISKENINILKVLEKRSHLKKYFIYLTLYKIKRNYSFERIGDLFDVSESYASQIFHRTTIILAHLMKTLIFWPSQDSIKKYLPIQFRAIFPKVQYIINCLEIEIQKPSSAKQQTLTWSDCKKCNTIKYLISSTPDGFINFVSKGYGGRTSDIIIFEKCGFLDVLPENSVVIADREFKNIESLLHKKKCSLERLPIVVNEEQMSEEDVLLAKPFATVQFHIERTIKCIRDFEIFNPYEIVNLDLVHKLDKIINIVCAIINIHKPIFKQQFMYF